MTSLEVDACDATEVSVDSLERDWASGTVQMKLGPVRGGGASKYRRPLTKLISSSVIAAVFSSWCANAACARATDRTYCIKYWVSLQQNAASANLRATASTLCKRLTHDRVRGIMYKLHLMIN